ncbi:MAG: AAA family ATPase [Acetobacteraceae bacterium]|nr:AAA family ATPase [Acetobacteraceae bacterium]
MKLMLVGRPGVGKTTVARAVMEALGRRAGGFWTGEIREGGERRGFCLVTAAGDSSIMAHVAWAGRMPRVGRYGVDVGVVDRLAVSALRSAVSDPEVECVVVDEIGRMELLSPAFRRAVESCFRSPKAAVATAREGADPFVDELMRSEGVEVLRVTSSSRQRMAAEVLRRLGG